MLNARNTHYNIRARDIVYMWKYSIQVYNSPLGFKEERGNYISLLITTGY